MTFIVKKLKYAGISSAYNKLFFKICGYVILIHDMKVTPKLQCDSGHICMPLSQLTRLGTNNIVKCCITLPLHCKVMYYVTITS